MSAPHPASGRSSSGPQSNAPGPDPHPILGGATPFEALPGGHQPAGSHNHLAPHLPEEGEEQGFSAAAGIPEVGPLPRLTQRSPGRRLAKKPEPPPCPLTPEQR